MTHPRGLSEDEAAAWEKLSATVEPLHHRRPPIRSVAPTRSPPSATPKPRHMPTQPRNPVQPLPPSARKVAAPGNLDSHWDRRLKAGDIAPDFSLDLHDHGTDAAYQRLMNGMEQARSVGARVVLVITGRSRPVDPADRATRRGVIRAKILDWLAASEHGEAIAAIRKAHRRHGGEGALYIVLRRSR
ncbi:Smr/MutS family protein [Parerythrobacter aestuarii]|uniref:Smr/MutS family protein n=1 Tax=Parerythrobacter aestuarii TaxID=3020909 RepID=UPI0024DEE49E|nr:Smr/MutS family protein [Parerythrobacter aestuarii]